MEIKSNISNVKEYIVNWLSSYVENSKTSGFTLGVSGGIDSGVVSTLCAMTEKPVLILSMPIHQSSDEVTRTEKHITWLKENYPNVTSMTIDLTKAYDVLHEAYGQQTVPVTEEEFEFSMSNTRSRLRMTTLYQYAGTHKYLVAGTGNKVEDFGIGFYSKYGDGGVDLSPIADLMKSEVYSLGAELGLIQEILSAVPTDGLHDDGRTDEDQIGATYDELEWAMKFEEEFNSTMNRQEKMAKEITLNDREREVLSIYRKYHNANKHKMVEIPVCAIPTEVKYPELETEEG